MNTTLKFPQDILRLLYWVFFKPITLDRYIHEIDPTLPRAPGLFTLWRRGKTKSELRSLIPLAFFNILVTPWLPGLFLLMEISPISSPTKWFPYAFGFAVIMFLFALIELIAVEAFGLAFGVNFSVSVALTIGIYLGVISGALVGREASNMLLVAFVVFSGVALGMMTGGIATIDNPVSFTVSGIVIGVVGFAVSSESNSSTIGVLFGVSFLATHFRLLYYLFQFPLQFSLSRLAVSNPHLANDCLRFSPVQWDELW